MLMIDVCLFVLKQTGSESYCLVSAVIRVIMAVMSGSQAAKVRTLNLSFVVHIFVLCHFTENVPQFGVEL